MKSIKKIRGEHCINIFVSHELKSRLHDLAERYDRTLADMVRGILKIGIPVMEGITEAEEQLIREFIDHFRNYERSRKLKN